MSNWGIGLLFGFGPGARPEVLAIRDIEAHCPACGRENIVRRYDAHPFHSFTVARLRAALEAGAEGATGICAQCEATFDSSHAVRWVLHYGFPSGRGLIQGFADAASGERRWLLSPHHAIDVQLVPRWDEEEDRSRVEHEVLTREVVTEVFGRAFNAKEEARHAAATISAGSTLRLGPALAFVALPTGATEQDAVAAAGLGGLEVAERIAEGGAARTGFPGAPAEWLAGVPLREAVSLWGVASRAAVVDAARAIPATFPIEVRFDGADDAEHLALQGPDGAWSGDTPDLDVVGVTQEAARALLDPGDATRLEIDRLLHGLTGLWQAAPADGSDDGGGDER